jgi:hypothetical protein|tara:strand:- start:826 stop:1152 length:327 start_codon:yes stop_codon:yes gene_type:complete
LRIKLFLGIPHFLLLAACSASIEPPNGMVDWRFANTTGTNILMSVYDEVCRRSYFRVSVPRSREIAMTTCATPEGQAQIRYRRRSYKTSEDNPWVDASLNASQVLLIR